jgi:hypothetical protein
MFAVGNDMGMKALALHVVNDRLSYWLTDYINSLSVISGFPVTKSDFSGKCIDHLYMLSLARERVFLTLVDKTSKEGIA